MSGEKKAKRAADAEDKATRTAAKLRDNRVVAAMGSASEVADQPPLVALGLGTLALGAVLRQPTLARSGARMLAAHAIATGVKTLLKHGVDRTRPARALADGRHRLAKGRGSGDTDFNSFPSGHTAGAIAVAEAVARDNPRAATPARLAAGAIGAMQLPRGAHYLSDVAVGAAIGWLSERIASAALAAGERAFARMRADRGEAAEAEAHPS